jgi:nitroreductase
MIMKRRSAHTGRNEKILPELFMELVRRRQSVRGYAFRAVENDKIRRCIEAARLAPSACNSQPWRFIVVDEPELKNQLADLTADRWLPLNHWTKQAPVHVVIVVEPANLTSCIGAAVKKRDFPWIDVGITAEHFCLQAAAEGLGTCMLGWFKEEKVKKLLGIPVTRRIGLLITLGYPADGSIRPKIRKSIDDILCWNRYT